MSEYEITYLADPTLDETAKDKIDQAIDKLITDQTGEISYASSTDAPGSRRRLHFPIRQQRVAWLRTIQAKLSPNKINDLKSTIKKQPGIMRVSVLQTSRRKEVSVDILDSTNQTPAQPTAPDQPQKQTAKVTMKEVEEKIEEALEEEVK